MLAVSGGVDSMVLLNAAVHVLGADRLVVATFDHGTGAAATAARDHVAAWCAAAGVSCVTGRAAAPLTTEEELRDARWRFLRAAARDAGSGIATAHTADDQIETVLLRVLRGAGARGIAGLFAETDVQRPLLDVTRAEVAAYAAARDVTWVEDPSNASRRHLRNRVRHDLLPALRLVRPDLPSELLTLSRRAAELRADVERFVRETMGVRVRPRGSGIDAPVDAFAGRSAGEVATLWPAVAALAGARLDRRGIARLVEFTAAARVGARVEVAGGWEVVRSRDALQLRASGEVAPEARPLRPIGAHFGDWSIVPCRSVGADSWSAWLPGDRPMTVRAWRPGDVMTPRAGARPRKVKHLLSRAGVTGHERARWPVVIAGDEIVWIPGVRRTDAATARSGGPVLPFACEYHCPRSTAAGQGRS